MSSSEVMAAREAEAVDWFLRLAKDDDAEQWRQFEAWLAADPTNAATYARLEALMINLDGERAAILQALGDAAVRPAAPIVALERARAAPHVRRGRFWYRGPAAIGCGLAAATVAAAVVITGSGPRTVKPSPPSPAAVGQAFTTRAGELRDVTLTDGSRLRLNGGSLVRISFTSQLRRVELVRGEGSFDVAHLPGRPFQVVLGDRQVTVIGTRFNIVRDSGEVRVVVGRGVVSIDNPTDGASPRLVKAGERLSYREGAADDRLVKVDPAAAFAWRQGYRIYSNERLGSVVKDLSRSFDAPIRTAGDASELRFSGVMMLDSEDAVVRRLEAYLPVKAHRQADAIVLEPATQR